MLALEWTGQVIQPPFDQRRRFTFERLVQTAYGQGVLVLGQMREDVSSFVHLAALDKRKRANQDVLSLVASVWWRVVRVMPESGGQGVMGKL